MAIRKRSWGDDKTAWVCDYKDGAGTRRLKTFATKKAADAWATTTLYQVKEGTHTPDGASVTVREAGEAWIAEATNAGLEPSTVRQYRQHVDQHIVPFIGAEKLSRLTTAGIKELTTMLRKGGRSPSMVGKVRISLGAILGEAQERGQVSRNVVREMNRNKRRTRGHEAARHKGKVAIPTKDEIRAMLAKAEGRWRPLFVTALFTGLRASELRGLAWNDVDLDRKVIRVSQRADRWNTIGSPKSAAGQREIPLAPMAANTLKEWKLACPKGELGLVFPNGKGKVENHANIYRRCMVALQMTAGVTTDAGKAKYGVHELRHAAASLFIEQGMTAKRVQTIMGHGSIQMTFDTYGHLFPSPDEDQEAVKQIEARLIG